MRWLLLMLCVAFSSTVVWAEQAEPFDFEQTVKDLNTNSYSTKGKLVEKLALSGDERALEILKIMSEGDLYAIEETGVIVKGKRKDYVYQVTDIFTGEALGEYSGRDLDKIRINNRLRRQLRGMIATLELSHPKESIRLAAAENIIKSPSDEMLPYLTEAIEKEESKSVLEVMEAARGIIWINTGDEAKRLQGIEIISDFPHREVKGVLMGLLFQEEGEYIEESKAVIAAAEAGLKKYERKANFYKLVENLFFGLSAGSVLLLAAVGLAITFGVMGVINMAHGEMIMIGAYTTYVIQLIMPNYIEYSLFVAIPAAFIVSGLFGIAIERGVIRFLYGRPLETLLATFGISLILQQLVRSVFSPLNRTVITPDWMSGSWQINGMLSLTFNRLYIIVFAAIVFVGLILLLKRTHFGLQMRAVTLNRPMASSMGIRTGWVDAMTFGLGSGIAGVAGVAISQLTNVGPNLGQSYIIDSFMVVVFGGVGNLFGTLFGAMTLGIINKFAEPWTGAVLAKILILVAIILFIQRRPRGMFALKGRSVEG
ncbi:MAG: urea ABC transporter permease subunit UrtB [Ketobacteraceae bacterium]|nr:urea ABC transporter permease subunit UrtB [Ketobacteraceae bacterium]